MTTVPAGRPADPAGQLRRSRELAHRIRRDQRVTWLPLFVFAAALFVAVPVTRAGHPVATGCRALPGAGPAARVCLGHNSATFVYWPIALALAYLVIAVGYAHRSRARGVGSRVRAYVTAGILIAVVVTALAATIGFLVVALVPIDFGWTMPPGSGWGLLPRLVIDGAVLLVAGSGFAVAQRPRRPAAT